MIERTVPPGQRAADDAWRLTAWLGLTAFFAILAYGSNVGASEQTADEPLYESSFFVASTIGFAIMVAAALLVAMGTRKREFFALRRPRSWPRALGWSILLLVAVFALGAALSPFVDPGEEQGLLPEHWPPPDALVFGLNAFSVVVIAPLAEELMFRGAGYSVLERFGWVVASVGSAAGWAAAHGLLEAFPLIFVLGLGLGFLRRASGSIVPGVVLHGAFNAIALSAAAGSAAG
jgi:membrane protease YdiL (CAAX protease family)